MMPSTRALMILESAVSNTFTKKQIRDEADARTREAETATQQVMSALCVLKETSITAALAHDDAAAANEKAGNTGRAKHHRAMANAHREYMQSLGSEEETTEMQRLGVAI